MLRSMAEAILHRCSLRIVTVIGCLALEQALHCRYLCLKF